MPKSASRPGANSSKRYVNAIGTHQRSTRPRFSMNSSTSPAATASMRSASSPGPIPSCPRHPGPAGRSIREAVREALVVLWEAADRICGKRLKAILPGLISAMERHGHLALDPNVRQLLLAASPATIDRLLAPIRGTAGHRRKRKPTTKSSREIPVRTFADWNEPGPGFLEIDFVAHGGDSMQGTFLWSLVATDVCSGWTEAVALVAREQSLVVEGLEVIRRQLPVPILGIDSDNDSAFINETLQGYCKKRQIEFTRSRAVPEERPGLDRAEERLGDPPVRGLPPALRPDRRPVPRTPLSRWSACM